jgi:carboxymethylenebutenolidase
MCHDEDSRPPGPPSVGPVAEHRLVELTARGGSAFAAYHAKPDVAAAAGGGGRSIVILPDVRGLHPYYEQLAIRFAEAGFHAVAIDYFGRSKGVSERGDDFDWQAEIGTVRPEHVADDVAAAAAFLALDSAGPVFTVGFCFGGSQSWRLAASELPLAGCIGFYGRPSMVADVEPDIHLPLLMLVAGGDAFTPLKDFQDMDVRLTAAGKEHETYVYDGAPHSFFDRSYGEWGEACRDAWRRILSFTGTHA